MGRPGSLTLGSCAVFYLHLLPNMVVMPAWLPVQFCLHLLQELLMQTSSASSLHTEFQDYHEKINKKILYCWILQLL